MKQSELLTVTFEDLRRNKITVSAPLAGFAAAYQKIE
jgi:hypothetical protein